MIKCRGAIYKEKQSMKKMGEIQERWSSHCGIAETKLTGFHEDTGSIPDLTQWVRDLVLS